MQIRDRIKELRRVPARDLIPNKKNWRKHPKSQADAMREVLESIGYAGALLAREEKGKLHLIDGHMRTETTPDAIVPVLVLDVTAAEADTILATFDPLSAMAVADSAKLEELMAGMTIGEGALADMMKGVRDTAKEISESSSGPSGTGSLSEDFGVPPFSVLNAREGAWQDRKREWLSMGIQSELGRGGAPGGSPRPAAQLTANGHTQRGDGTGRVLQAVPLA